MIRQLKVATFENSDNTISNIYIHEFRNHGTTCDLFHDISVKGPLSLRAWTLQEQILSSRMVHFEREEMFWEDRASQDCECREIEDASDYKTEMETEATRQSFRTWHSIVDQYHRRSFNYPSDFLPALSGIAARLQQFGAGDYVAGLWKSNAVVELLWYVSGKFRRAKPYRAPSWSWASIATTSRTYSTEDQIKFWAADFDTYEQSCRILNMECSQLGATINSAVISGSITIEGRLLQLESFERPRIRYSEYQHMPLRDLPFHSWPFRHWSLSSIHLDLQDQKSQGIALYCLPVYQTKIWSNGVEFYGLVLRISDAQRDIYERVGTWKLRESHIKDAVLQDLSDKCPIVVVTVE